MYGSPPRRGEDDGEDDGENDGENDGGDDGGDESIDTSRAAPDLALVTSVGRESGELDLAA